MNPPPASRGLEAASTPSPGRPSITLGSVAERLGVTGLPPALAERLVGDVRHDSRAVLPGELFVARAGGRTHGAEHARDAEARGAVAVLSEADIPGLGIPVLRVADARRALGLVAERVHGDPSRALALVGITGTNGKTTSAWLAEHALTAGGLPTARLGTLGYSFLGDRTEGSLTTPEADAVSRALARAVASGARAAVMEVSSHALDQARVDALRFAVAAFTNLTQDHLDYHPSLEAYAAAKARLFLELAPGASVINVDDPVGADLAARAPGRVLRVSRAGRGDVRPRSVTVDARGLHGTVELPSGPVTLASRLVGAHNLENVLLVLGIAEALGRDVAAVAAAFGAVPAVPGRLERCDGPDDDVTVLVDYAHTPDALTRALVAARGLGAGRIHCVFGCGGDRDPLKRPLMARAVAGVADRATVTNDNPRSEEPAAIARAILEGFVGATLPVDVELDRARAIEAAILGAAAGDVVVLAGKGHEPYQLVGSEVRAFDDRDEARRALALRRAVAGGTGAQAPRSAGGGA